MAAEADGEGISTADQWRPSVISKVQLRSATVQP
jgi:hypothetical protein